MSPPAAPAAGRDRGGRDRIGPRRVAPDRLGARRVDLDRVESDRVDANRVKPERSGTLIASDLDRTLIYSPSALQLPTVDEESPNLVSVEILEGRPNSFMTLAASLRLAELSLLTTFVPTTTRTIGQYLRVRFPGISPAFAVTSNGGNILLDGVPDADWHRATERAIAACDVTLTDVRHELKRRTHDDWVLKRRVGDDLFCYLVVDLLRMPDDFIESWTSWCEDRGWRVSVQGRKIYAIPQPLTKERAMLAVADQVDAAQVLAAGDGALDAGFLAAADAGIRPPHGELAALNWQHPRVAVGDRPGVLAADDITSWFAARLAAGSATRASVDV